MYILSMLGKVNTKIILLITFFLINLITLTHYSYSWDDLIHRQLGQNVFEFFTQGKPLLLETSMGQHIASYGSLTATLGYLSEILFNQNLKVLPNDTAFHITILPFALLALWALMQFTKKYIGQRESLWAFIFLITMPRFIGHLHQNIKDIPSASLFALTIIAFANAFHKPSLKNWLLSSVTFGLALATKINALQIPIILFAYLLIIWLKNLHFKPNKSKFLIPNSHFPAPSVAPSETPPNGGAKWSEVGYLLSSLFLGFLVAILFWPALWEDPVGNFFSSLKFFQTQWVGGPVLYFGELFTSGINVPWHYPLGILLVTTPLLTIFMAILGIAISLKKSLIHPSSLPAVAPSTGGAKAGNLHLLLLLWFFVPLSKYFFFKVPIYDDTRQFMEVLFPLSIFAAIGLSHSWDFLRSIRLIGNGRDFSNRYIRLWRIRNFSIFLFFILAFYFAVPFIRLHPYEMIYFNELVGSPKAVYTKGLFDIDFWGISLKEATNWLNANAQPNQKVYSTFDVAHIIQAYLRPDLKLDYNNYQTADYLIILNRKTFFYPQIVNFLKGKQPIYTVTQAQVPLSWIYKLK